MARTQGKNPEAGTKGEASGLLPLACSVFFLKQLRKYLTVTPDGVNSSCEIPFSQVCLSLGQVGTNNYDIDSGQEESKATFTPPSLIGLRAL